MRATDLTTIDIFTTIGDNMKEELQDLVKVTTRGSFILLIGKVSSTLLLALGTLLVARFLGPVNYGSLNKADSVVSIANILMNLGVQQAMIKYLAQYRYEGKTEHMRVLIETGVIISVFSSLLSTVLVFLVSGYIADNIFMEPVQEIYIRYLSLSLIGQALLTLAQGITIGYEKMELSSLLSVVYSILKSVIGPVLVFIGLGTLGAIYGQISPVLLTAILGIIFIAIIYRNEKTSQSPISHMKVARMILTYGFPLYVSSILGGLLPQLYTSLLGIWETNERIGNYSVALNFSALISFITMPISTTIFPLFSKLDKEQSELGFLYRNAVKYSTLLVYPIIFTLISLADQIIMFLFQDQYTYAPYYLRIYILIFVLTGLGSACNNSLLKGQNRTDIIFRIALIRFIISVPLSYFAIKIYGVEGLLYYFIIIQSISTILTLSYIRRLFSFKLNMDFLLKILLISITSTFIVYTAMKVISIASWMEILIGGTLSLSLYAIGVIILKALTQQDYQYLSNLSESFGPFAPLFRNVINLLMRLS